ncbi:hypothetical protein [Actinacidiphila acididurans]|uniref:Uncharacterized protein n=1 Tax=Actinacidiphila acididurans TaxID=2784346 RepID=A0ABS2TTY9_9ACTN|nr:hypothetical protein [Actinacidiphila acididurans]MBM9506796.1 hypothetical protein [Actinacidiphila acididurans]
MLARSEHFTTDYPFAALVVFRQSLPIPAVLDPAVGTRPITGTSTACRFCTPLC